MSISIVEHVRGKSTAKGSARTLQFDLALYANDCCGVAWASDTTLYHDVNVSRQRIHELKNALEHIGELVILERPGLTNLYFVAWQGKPLGGTSKDDGRHDPRCPLRHPHLARRCARLWPDRFRAPTAGEGSDIPDTPPTTQGSEIPDPQGSEISEGRGQNSLTRKPEKTISKTPRLRIAHARDKPEMHNPFWCDAHGFVHSERLPDHRPGCWLESPDPEGTRSITVRLTSRADAGPTPMAQVFDKHLRPET